MPSPQRLSAVLALAAFSFVFSACVDTSQVTVFACSEGGRCPASLICCPDSLCKASCNAGGGTATGGGSAQGGGTASGGGGGS
ncbi:MAG TPA: hypothetical protein VGE37_09975, partial [Archangium sp.]